MSQPHEVVLAQAEAFFSQRLTPPPSEHPAKPLSARRLRRRDEGQDRLNSAGQYGDLGECWRALSDLGGFELQTRLAPIPVRLGAWEGQPDLLALVLGEEESRWVSFYRPKQGEVRLASVDWELRGISGIGRFFFDQPMPRFQVWTGSPPEVAVEAICTPNGDLDFVSPAGLFKGAQIARLEEKGCAVVAFNEDGGCGPKMIRFGDTARHTFAYGENRTTTVEVGLLPDWIDFKVMPRDTSGDLELFIRVLIDAADFEPQLILNRILFDPQELEELATVIQMPRFNGQIRR